MAGVAHERYAMTLRLSCRAEVQEPAVRAAVPSTRARLIQALIRKVADAEIDRALTDAGRGLEKNMAVLEAPSQHEPELEKELRHAIDIIAMRARLHLAQELRTDESQLGAQVVAVAAEPTEEGVRCLVALALKECAAYVFAQVDLPGFADLVSAGRAPMSATLTKEAMTALLQMHVERLGGALDLRVTEASREEGSTSKLSAAIRNILADGGRDVEQAAPCCGTETPLDSVLRRIARYPHQGAAAEAGPPSGAEQLAARMLAALNARADVLRGELEREVALMVEQDYPGVVVRGSLRFQQGSIEVVAGLALSWVGGVILDAATKDVEARIRDMVKLAFERVWTRFSGAVGLTPFLAMPDPDVAMIQARALDVSTAAATAQASPVTKVEPTARTAPSASGRLALVLALASITLLLELVVLVNQLFVFSIHQRF